MAIFWMKVVGNSPEKTNKNAGFWVHCKSTVYNYFTDWDRSFLIRKLFILDGSCQAPKSLEFSTFAIS
jgi:hypothetical protein